MNLDRIFSVAGALVAVAAIAVLVQSPNTSSVMRAVGESFADAVRAAQGRG